MNSNARKNIIYSLVLFALVLLVYAYRTREGKPEAEELPKSESGKVSFSGKTMGTDYQVTYLDEEKVNVTKGNPPSPTEPLPYSAAFGRSSVSTSTGSGSIS